MTWDRPGTDLIQACWILNDLIPQQLQLAHQFAHWLGILDEYAKLPENSFCLHPFQRSVPANRLLSWLWLFLVFQYICLRSSSILWKTRRSFGYGIFWQQVFLLQYQTVWLTGQVPENSGSLSCIQRDAHVFMHFLFCFWSFTEIVDIYFVWFIKFFLRTYHQKWTSNRLSDDAIDMECHVYWPTPWVLQVSIQVSARKFFWGKAWGSEEQFSWLFPNLY